MNPTWETKFFKNLASVLLTHHYDLLRECTKVAECGRIGCAWVRYDTVNDFAEGTNYVLRYLSLDELMRVLGNTCIHWPGYIKLDPSSGNFVLAMSVMERGLHKTIGVKDDGGPPDATEIAYYPRVAFANQCYHCSKSLLRRRVVGRCVECGDELTYCSDTCRGADAADHILLAHRASSTVTTI